jgi:hypothetical protein
MGHFQDDPLARPQCTWLNQADWAADITNEGNKAPWRIILEGAQERGMAAQIMGETGGGGYTTNPDMAYVFGVPVPAGYRGVWWFDYNTLTGGAGSNATLSHLKTFSMDVLPR